MRALFSIQQGVGIDNDFPTYHIAQDDEQWHDIVRGDGHSYRGGGPPDITQEEGEYLKEFKKRADRCLDSYEAGYESGFYEKGGKVAIIHSVSWGAAWSTRFPDSMYFPILAEAIESGKSKEKIRDIVKKYFDVDWNTELGITFLKKGQKFCIEEYDGSESVVTHDPRNLIAGKDY